jgi:hypothetical protein
MASHVGRLYALSLALVVFFLAWALIAARPWAAQSTSGADPRIAALAARERRIRHESLVVARIVRHRWAVYRTRLRRREQQIVAAKRAHAAVTNQARLAAAAAPAAASPSVRVVTLPPLTITRTS